MLHSITCVPSSNNGDNDLDSLDVPAHYSKAALQQTPVLNVAHTHLVSLLASPSCRIADVIRNVTTLQASHNAITTLHGVEAFVSLEVLNLSYNALSVLDAHAAMLLCQLTNLRVVDVSHNQLCLMDLESATSALLGGAAADGGGSQLKYVTSINLSHNVLIEVPELRVMPALQLVNLDYNGIDDLTDLDARLPLLSLHTLQLRHNRLRSAASLVPLAALANTLRHLQLFGNSFNSASELSGAARSWWWRPLCLWLCPLLETLDLVGFTSSEQQVTAQLFREHSELSAVLLELMNPTRKEHLVAYLRQQSAAAVAPADLADIVQSMEEADSEAEHRDEAERRNQVLTQKAYRENVGEGDDESSVETMERAAAAPPPPAADTPVEVSRADMAAQAHLNDHQRAHKGSLALSTAMGSSTSAAQLTDVVRAMQRKLRSLSAVVETLWRADLARRVFAARVIQRHVRGMLARHRLPEKQQETLRSIRAQLHHLATPTQPSAASVAAAAAHAAPVISPAAEASDSTTARIHEVLATMRGLQQVITSMWDDLGEFRAMAAREQRRAAVTLQRYYRGHRARMTWRLVKDDYDSFVHSLGAYVTVLQRVGRGRMARTRLSHEHARRREVWQLRDEVSELRGEVEVLRGLVGQVLRHQRLQQYGDDPHKAMDQIIDDFMSEHHHSRPQARDPAELHADVPTGASSAREPHHVPAAHEHTTSDAY